MDDDDGKHSFTIEPVPRLSSSSSCTNDDNHMMMINFHFSNKVITREVWLLPEDEDSPEELIEIIRELPVTRRSLLHLSRQQLFDSESPQEIIKRELRHWLLYEENILTDLVENIVRETKDCVPSTSFSSGKYYDVLDMYIELTVEYGHNVDDVYEDGSIKTVPATESSIRSLKRKRMEDCMTNENCSICLDEFSSSSDCDPAVSMPCSHVFHGDCIKKWLRTSHFCPICRYEMPTEELDDEIFLQVYESGKIG